VYASSSSVYGVPAAAAAAAAACTCGPAPATNNNGSDSNSNSSRHVSAHGGSSSSQQYSSLLPSKECSARCGQPTSVYAASKRATEDVVAVYSHLYSIRAVGTAR
jgi:nucleoside-diphosphate-sugar epimerase